MSRIAIHTLKHQKLAKTFTYSMMHMVVAICVAYALSGSWAVALGIGIVEPIVQTFAYRFHENTWEKLTKWFQDFTDKELKAA